MAGANALVAAGSVTGTERIELTGRDTTASLVFDSGTLVVDAVRAAEAGGTLAFVQQARRLLVTLPATARAGDRRTIEISYHGAPRNGLTQRSVQRRGGKTAYRWRQDRAVSSFLYGFVAGAFTEAGDTHRGVTLTYLGSPFSTDELRRTFRHTPTIMAFMEERGGLAYGRPVLADAAATGLMAHELAHQWWGAYRERSQGREAYLKDVDGWRRRVEPLRAAGHDRPLVFPDWNRPTADDRAVVYQKGALALHELREQLGDGAFWAAVRAYTKAHAGRAVTSSDLQRAFEAPSGRTLAAFFDEWVRP